jgi:two-component system cell cycle sensor histidine kinase/response regulator CckA
MGWRCRSALERKETPRVLTGQETVLVVDDEEVVLRLCRNVLEGYGYRVFAVSTGEEAMKVSTEEKSPIHIVLTDVVIPRKSGPQLAKEIQAQRSDVKVLYMSGHTENAIVHRGVLDKGENFIEKPFSPEGLARKVREVLDH